MQAKPRHLPRQDPGPAEGRRLLSGPGFTASAQTSSRERLPPHFPTAPHPASGPGRDGDFLGSGARAAVMQIRSGFGLRRFFPKALRPRRQHWSGSASPSRAPRAPRSRGRLPARGRGRRWGPGAPQGWAVINPRAGWGAESCDLEDPPKGESGSPRESNSKRAEWRAPWQAGTLVSTAWPGGLGESPGLRGATPSLSTAECLAWALYRRHLGTKKNKFD